MQHVLYFLIIIYSKSFIILYSSNVFGLSAQLFNALHSLLHRERFAAELIYFIIFELNTITP